MTGAEVGHDYLGDIIRFSRRICVVIVIAAFASYGVAWYVWTLGQTLGAVVLASMGYLLFRSLRKIAFNLTWQHFNQKAGYTDLIQRLNSHILTQKEAAIRQHIDQTLKTNPLSPPETHL